MFKKIERALARRRKRRYQFILVSVFDCDVGLFCCRCKERVDFPQERAREFYHKLPRHAVVSGVASMHQCEDLK